LQDKLDSLADIERTLTPRPRALRHEGGRPRSRYRQIPVGRMYWSSMTTKIFSSC
jgi:hypothetical protein